MASKRPAVSRSVSAYRAADTRKEREESVACNISPEMLPLWERTRALFHGTPHHRWEQFTEYVEAHPGEVDAACQSAADAWLDRWLGSQRRVTIRRHDRAEDRRVTGDHPSRPSSSTPEPSCTASPRPRSPTA